MSFFFGGSDSINLNRTNLSKVRTISLRFFFSSAVQLGNTLYLSGMIGIDKDTGKLVPGGIVPETEQVFKNIEALLCETGSSFTKGSFYSFVILKI